MTNKVDLRIVSYYKYMSRGTASTPYVVAV